MGVLSRVPRSHRVVATGIALGALGCDVGLVLSGHGSSSSLAAVNGAACTLLGQVLNLGTSQVAAGIAQATADKVDVVAKKVFNGGLAEALQAALETPTDLQGKVQLTDARKASRGSTPDVSEPRP